MEPFATIIGPLFFPSDDPSTVLLAAFAAYGIALVVRPIGALIFGRMADLRGRRAVFVLIVLIMAGATAAVGVLPSYAAIGILLAALPLGLIGGFVRRRVSETSQFLAASEAGQMIRKPFAMLWATDRAALMRGFTLNAAGSLAFNRHFERPGCQ